MPLERQELCGYCKSKFDNECLLERQIRIDRDIPEDARKYPKIHELNMKCIRESISSSDCTADSFYLNLKQKKDELTKELKELNKLITQTRGKEIEKIKKKIKIKEEKIKKIEEKIKKICLYFSVFFCYHYTELQKVIILRLNVDSTEVLEQVYSELYNSFKEIFQKEKLQHNNKSIEEFNTEYFTTKDKESQYFIKQWNKFEHTILDSKHKKEDFTEVYNLARHHIYQNVKSYLKNNIMRNPNIINIIKNLTEINESVTNDVKTNQDILIGIKNNKTYQQCIEKQQKTIVKGEKLMKNNQTINMYSSSEEFNVAFSKLITRCKIFSDNLQQKIENIFSFFELDYIIEETIELVETGDKDRETLINEVKKLLYEVEDVSGSDEEQIFTFEYVRETREKLDKLAVQLTEEIVLHVQKQSESTESLETTPKPVYINIPSWFSLVKNEIVSVKNEIVSGFNIVSGISKITNDLFPEYSYEPVPIPVRSSNRSSNRSSDRSLNDVTGQKIIELGQESLLLVIDVKEDKDDQEYPFKLCFFLHPKKEKNFPDNIEMILWDHSEEKPDKITSVKPNNSQSGSLCGRIKSQKGDKIELQIKLKDVVVFRRYFEI